MADTVEQKHSRMELVDEAIQLALQSRWEEALAKNLEVLERYGEDEDTQNRLGKVLLELGRLEESREHYQKALAINPANQIASRNLVRLEMLISEGRKLERRSHAVAVELFTEEPGKSSLVAVMTTGRIKPSDIIPGDEVTLTVKDGRLIASMAGEKVIGEVDPKVGHRLAELMTTGNNYSAAVARVHGERLDVMIREVFQSPENALTPSFPAARGGKHDDFRPYARESLLTERMKAPRLEEEELLEEAHEEEQELEVMDESTPEEEPLATEIEDSEDEDVRPEDEY
ncbi:MAG: tetratricopeptide repeat protein [Candidatus Dormibacteria bacterium]